MSSGMSRDAAGGVSGSGRKAGRKHADMGGARQPRAIIPPMKFWPAWAERMAQSEPPPGIPPAIYRLFARSMGLFAIYVTLTAGILVVVGIVLLVVVLVG
jgi:hypothetical protein